MRSPLPDDLVTAATLAPRIRVSEDTAARRIRAAIEDGAEAFSVATGGRPALAIRWSAWIAWCRGELRRAA